MLYTAEHLFTVHPSYTVHCTPSFYCTFFLHCTLHTLFTLHTAHYLYTTHWTSSYKLHTSQCTPLDTLIIAHFHIHHILHTARLLIRSTLYTAHLIHFTHYTLHISLFSHTIRCTFPYKLHTIHRAQCLPSLPVQVQTVRQSVKDTQSSAQENWGWEFGGSAESSTVFINDKGSKPTGITTG